MSLFPDLEGFAAVRAVLCLVPNAFRFLEDRVVLLMASCDHGAGWMCGGLGWLGYVGKDRVVLLMASCDHGAGWMCGGLGWLGYVGIDQIRIYQNGP